MTPQKPQQKSHQQEPGPEHDGDPGRGQPSSEYAAGDAGVPVQDLAQVMARLARELNTEHGMDATMHALVVSAVAAIPGGESAGITEVLQKGRQMRVPYASDEFVATLDKTQHALGEGPCLDTAYQHHTVRVEDFATEQRWPTFAARAHQLGAGSLLSLQLYVHDEDLAALNVYSRQKNAFTDESEQIGLIFAAHAAVAMSDARHERQMRVAIDGRDVIGQAKGILMERFKITAGQAFDVLVKASSETNIKLRDVAETFAGTGDLPTR